ncbi:MAG: hypothetical protein SFV17_24220 [Candidatus Obscuribacter sp.]|nr:hypothetical protein [Candidatus Obscuribacter sp.]
MESENRPSVKISPAGAKAKDWWKASCSLLSLACLMVMTGLPAAASGPESGKEQSVSYRQQEQELLRLIGANDQSSLAATRVAMTLPDLDKLNGKDKTQPLTTFDFYGQNLLALIDAPEKLYGLYKGKTASLCLSCSKEKEESQEEGNKVRHATVVIFQQVLPDMAAIYRQLRKDNSREEIISLKPGSTTLPAHLTWTKGGSRWYLTNRTSNCLLITNELAILQKQANLPGSGARTKENPASLQKSEAITDPVQALSFQEKLNSQCQSWIFTGIDAQKQRPAILVQSAGIGLELTVEALPLPGLDQKAALQLKDLKPRLERSAGTALEETNPLQLKLFGGSETLKKCQRSLMVEMNPYLACMFGN